MNISVCIPTYNQANFIEQTIWSAAQQSVRPSEIIVSDDCSTDETTTILRRLQAQIPSLIVIRQPVNTGLLINNDFCLRAAKGDFIVQLDSDDYLAPDFIQTLSAQLIAHPDAGYAHAAVQDIDQAGQPLGQRRLGRKTGFQSGDAALKAALSGYRVTSNMIMLRRSALANVNYLTGRAPHGQDYHLSVAMAAAGYGNVYVNEILTYYRYWTDTDNKRKRRKQAEISGLRQVFEDAFEPAYASRNWNVAALASSRATFASRYADCLAWPVYSSDEKQALENELYRLSAAPKVKLYAWLYLHGLGSVLDTITSIQNAPRHLAKRMLNQSAQQKT